MLGCFNATCGSVTLSRALGFASSLRGFAFTFASTDSFLCLFGLNLNFFFLGSSFLDSSEEVSSVVSAVSFVSTSSLEVSFFSLSSSFFPSSEESTSEPKSALSEAWNVVFTSLNGSVVTGSLSEEDLVSELSSSSVLSSTTFPVFVSSILILTPSCIASSAN